MNAKEILDYTFKFWENRKTLDKTVVYKERHEKFLHLDYIFVTTPWGTTHKAVTISRNENIDFFLMLTNIILAGFWIYINLKTIQKNYSIICIKSIKEY